MKIRGIKVVKVKSSRGDTIIEVMLAFGVFAALAVSVTVMMNRSVATAQRSLEITQVRQQIDAQADLLRYARDNQLPDWDAIKNPANLYTGARDALTGQVVDCATFGSLLGNNRAFFMSTNISTGAVSRQQLSASNFTIPDTTSRIDFNSQRSMGMWILATYAQGSSSSSPVKAYDMYIRTCWYTVGQNVPLTLTTIVRMYDT